MWVSHSHFCGDSACSWCLVVSHEPKLLRSGSVLNSTLVSTHKASAPGLLNFNRELRLREGIDD